MSNEISKTQQLQPSAYAIMILSVCLCLCFCLSLSVFLSLDISVCIYVAVFLQLLRCIKLFATPRTAAHPPGSSVHGISHARILEWDAISFFRGSSQPGSHIYICMYIYTYVYTYICMYVHVYIYIYIIQEVLEEKVHLR